jgi:hypothetical protein
MFPVDGPKNELASERAAHQYEICPLFSSSWKKNIKERTMYEEASWWIIIGLGSGEALR